MTTETLVLQHSPIITAGYIIQVVFSLAIVLALILLSAKYLVPKLRTSTAGRFIKVLDRVLLEPQVTAYILQAGQNAWLIVTSNKQVAKIDKIDPESLSK